MDFLTVWNIDQIPESQFDKNKALSVFGENKWKVKTAATHLSNRFKEPKQQQFIMDLIFNDGMYQSFASFRELVSHTKPGNNYNKNAEDLKKLLDPNFMLVPSQMNMNFTLKQIRKINSFKSKWANYLPDEGCRNAVISLALDLSSDPITDVHSVLKEQEKASQVKNKGPVKQVSQGAVARDNKNEIKGQKQIKGKNGRDNNGKVQVRRGHSR